MKGYTIKQTMKVYVMPGISIAISDRVKVLIFGKAQLENFLTLQTRKFPNGPLYKMATLWKVGPSQCIEADLNEVIEYAKPFRAITALESGHQRGTNLRSSKRNMLIPITISSSCLPTRSGSGDWLSSFFSI